MAKKRVVRPNLGGVLRPRADEPRRNFLYIEVTKDEGDSIRHYCVERHISLSQFLAELLLGEAAKPKRTENIMFRPELELTPAEYEKLEVLAMLYSQGSLDGLIRELIQPHLDTQKLHTDRDTEFVRFYLSEEEHKTISDYITPKDIPIGKYATMIALRAVARERKKKK